MTLCVNLLLRVAYDEMLPEFLARFNDGRFQVTTVMNSTGGRDRCFRKKRDPARTRGPMCRILRVVSRLLGNLDAVQSAAVKPGTTRKFGVRDD